MDLHEQNSLHKKLWVLDDIAYKDFRIIKQGVRYSLYRSGSYVGTFYDKRDLFNKIDLLEG